MSTFSIPTKAEVNPTNQATFHQLEKGLGFVPNLYAYYAKNETALNDYLQFQNRKTTLSNKEKEVINLVVSEYNGCRYCQSAHTVIAGLNGFTEEEILSIRSGEVYFDSKLQALATFALAIVKSRGKVLSEAKENFFSVGYNEANLIDVVFVVGDKIISNYTHNIADFAIDFPLAPELSLQGTK